MQRLRLKSSAVSQICSHLSQYMSKEKPSPRFTAATSRLAKQSAVIDKSVAKLPLLEMTGQFKPKI